MVEPLPVVRAVTYERDKERCVSCSARVGLQAHHRQAVGMGGSKVRPLAHELLSLCALCNEAMEGALQHVALKRGWKVPRWVEDCSRVPVFYPFDLSWWVLDRLGGRVQVDELAARRMMRAVYGEDWAA